LPPLDRRLEKNGLKIIWSIFFCFRKLCERVVVVEKTMIVVDPECKVRRGKRGIELERLFCCCFCFLQPRCAAIAVEPEHFYMSIRQSCVSKRELRVGGNCLFERIDRQAVITNLDASQEEIIGT